MPRRLPIFPLGTVLLPYGLLPLHVFEPRYRELMGQLLGEPEGTGRPGAEMGIVLIERGHEVGGGDERSSLGTTARVVRAERFPDGRWFVLVAGLHRFRVVNWLPDDPYPLAEVEGLPPEQWSPSSDEALRIAEGDVRRSIALAGELGEPVAQPELSADPLVTSWQLCNAVPVGPLDRQALLGAATVEQRLTLLAAQAREAASLFAFRLGTG